MNNIQKFRKILEEVDFITIDDSPHLTSWTDESYNENGLYFHAEHIDDKGRVFETELDGDNVLNGDFVLPNIFNVKDSRGYDVCFKFFKKTPYEVN